MSSFMKVEEKYLFECQEAERCSPDLVAQSDITALFETFIPKQFTFDESILYDRQQALYFQAKFPQTNAAKSGSSNPLSIFIVHTYNDGRLLQKIDQIMRTIANQE